MGKIIIRTNEEIIEMLKKLPQDKMINFFSINKYSKEGLCLENVPQRICQENNGTWSEKKANELPICSLGCCIIADQASFVTMTRCKSLSTFFGVKTDYRPDITSERTCIETANAQDEGQFFIPWYRKIPLLKDSFQWQIYLSLGVSTVKLKTLWIDYIIMGCIQAEMFYFGCQLFSINLKIVQGEKLKQLFEIYTL